MAGCANKDLDRIRADHNQWHDKMWDDKEWDNFPGQRMNWFEHTSRTLQIAFSHLTPTPTLPAIPARPPRLVGTSVATLATEIKRVTKTLIDYGVDLVRYASDVNSGSHASCVTQTAAEFRELVLHKERMNNVPNPPTPPGNPTPLCVQFSKWAKVYFEWSERFECWENAMVACVPLLSAEGSQQPPRSKSTEEQLARRQVSPVPWPPWDDYQDEIA